jgi:hypothetical protein
MRGCIIYDNKVLSLGQVRQLLAQLEAARGEHKALLTSIAALLPAHPAEPVLGLAEDGAAEPEAEASSSEPAAERSGGGGGGGVMPVEVFRSRWEAGEAERLEGKFERHMALFAAHASSATGGVDLAAVDAEINPKTQTARRAVARKCVDTGTEMKAFTLDTFGDCYPDEADDLEEYDIKCSACFRKLDSNTKMFAGGHDSESFPGYCLCETCYGSSCRSLAELSNLDPLAQIVARARVLPADLRQSLAEMIAGVAMHPEISTGDERADPLENWLEVEDGVDDDGDPIERCERIERLIANDDDDEDNDDDDDDEDNDDDDEDPMEVLFDAITELCGVVRYIAEAADVQDRTALVEQLTAAIVQGRELPPQAPAAELEPESESAMVVSPRGGVAEYVVGGAGIAECNGVYTRSSDSDQDGVPSFINGEILMLRYKLPSGTQWWYLADRRSLDRTAGDYYRLQSNSDTPPLSGWQIDGQTPDGRTPLPIVSVASAAADTPASHAEPEPEAAAADILTTRSVVRQLRSRGKTVCSQDAWEAEFVAAELASQSEKEDVALELAADNWTGSLVGLWHLTAIGDLVRSGPPWGG